MCVVRDRETETREKERDRQTDRDRWTHRHTEKMIVSYMQCKAMRLF